MSHVNSANEDLNRTFLEARYTLENLRLEPQKMEVDGSDDFPEFNSGPEVEPP